jgi:hypothetical protein
MEKIRRAAFNARFGDGSLRKQSPRGNYEIDFVSTSLDYLTWKRDLCVDLKPSVIGTQTSGYGGKKPIYKFGTRVSVLLTNLAELSLKEMLESMDMLDLVLWYLDDGSNHRVHGTAHLYSNSFDLAENELISEHIYRVLGIARPVIRIDKKKDGRQFYYQYIPRIAAEVLMIEAEKFMNTNGITSLLYKTIRKTYTLNDHRKAVGRPPVIGPKTELSRVGAAKAEPKRGAVRKNG